jgi:hypothetical protein
MLRFVWYFNESSPVTQLVHIICTFPSHQLYGNLGSGKGKVITVLLTEHHATEAHWGVEVELHVFFDLGTRCR